MTTLYLDIEDSQDCVTVGEAEFCYYATPGRDVGEAQEFCQTKRGNLVSINSAAEQTAVHDLIKSVSGGTALTYIGYMDNRATGINWNWFDGKGGYTNWIATYPRNTARYPCAVLRNTDGEWHNSYCHYKFSFVCKIVSYSIVLT